MDRLANLLLFESWLSTHDISFAELASLMEGMIGRVVIKGDGYITFVALL